MIRWWLLALAAGQVIVQVPSTPAIATCNLQLATSATAFCEQFTAPENNGVGLRTGGLNGVIWGVSRTMGNTATGQGFYNGWGIPNLITCNGTVNATVPPNDVIICGGQLREAVNDNPTQLFENGTVAALTMYPKQPFDFTGRTGTIGFDVSDDSEGTHAVWPELWFTDTPAPGPFSHFATWLSLPQNGFGIRFAGLATGQFGMECPEGGTPPYVGVDSAIVINNYVENDTAAPVSTSPPINTANLNLVGLDCVAESTGPNPSGPTTSMNHFEIQVSQTRIDIYGTDAGSTTLKHLSYISGINLGATRGLVWLEDAHYNADKGGTPTQRIHTFVWDNFGFDGPHVARDLSYDAADQMVANSDGSVSLGQYSGVGATASWSITGIPNVQPHPAAAVKVLFNHYEDTTPNNLIVVVNGTIYTVPWPYPDTLSATWRRYAVTINASNISTGTNVVQLGADTSDMVSANVDIVFAGSGGIY